MSSGCLEGRKVCLFEAIPAAWVLAAFGDRSDSQLDSVLSLIISGVPSSLYSGRVPRLSVLKLQASSSLLKFDRSIGSPKEQVSFERWLKAQPQFELQLPWNIRRHERERIRTKR